MSWSMWRKCWMIYLLKWWSCLKYFLLKKRKGQKKTVSVIHVYQSKFFSSISIHFLYWIFQLYCNRWDFVLKLIKIIIHQIVEKLFKRLIYHLIIFHISSLFIWKHFINHKNVSSFCVNNQHQENQHCLFRFGQVLSKYNPNGSKVA